MCGFNSILSCAFLLSIFRSEIFVLMTQIRLQFPSFTIDECELSCAVCACCLIAMCFFCCFNVVAIPLFFLLQVQMLSEKKVIKFLVRGKMQILNFKKSLNFYFKYFLIFIDVEEIY